MGKLRAIILSLVLLCLAVSLLCRASAADAGPTNGLAVRERIGAAKRDLAFSVKTLRDRNFDFKKIENKPFLSAVRKLADALESPKPESEMFWQIHTAFWELVAVATQTADLANGPFSSALPGMTELENALGGFHSTARSSTADSISSLIDSLRGKAQGSKDDQMLLTLIKLADISETGKFAGTVHGQAYFIKSVYAHDWLRLTEAAEKLDRTVTVPGKFGPLPEKGLSDSDFEKYLQQIHSWEVIEPTNAVAFLARADEDELADEKTALSGEDDGDNAGNSDEEGEQDEDE